MGRRISGGGGKGSRDYGSVHCHAESAFGMLSERRKHRLLVWPLASDRKGISLFPTIYTPSIFPHRTCVVYMFEYTMPRVRPWRNLVFFLILSGK